MGNFVSIKNVICSIHGIHVHDCFQIHYPEASVEDVERIERLKEIMSDQPPRDVDRPEGYVSPENVVPAEVVEEDTDDEAAEVVEEDTNEEE